MSELSPDLLRRVLVAFHFETCDALFWRVDDDVLSIYVTCSDFFAWGCADVEPIETEADVELLEQARADLVIAEADKYPIWTAELYAARRRQEQPASFILGTGKHAMPEKVQPLFRAAGPDRAPNAGLLPLAN